MKPFINQIRFLLFLENRKPPSKPARGPNFVRIW